MVFASLISVPPFLSACRYVLWEDGSAQWSGLPQALHSKLLGRSKCLPRVQAMSCGARGEWFVRFWDGSGLVRGESTDLAKMVDDMRNAGNSMLAIEFGSKGSWAEMHQST